MKRWLICLDVQGITERCKTNGATRCVARSKRVCAGRNISEREKLNGMLLEGLRTLLSVIWVLVIQIFIIGELWVLRVAIDWWLDIDYVKRIEEWIRKKRSM